MVEIDKGPKPLGIAADDGERQRQVVARGANDGFRAAADTDPGPQRSGLDRREDALICQRRAQPAFPRHGVGLQQGREQIEFFLEQHFILREIVAEQRKGFGERAAPDGDLGAAVGGGIERRKPLENPNRVVRAEHGHGRAEQNPFGAAGDGRKHDLGSRYGEIGAMMLADAKGIDPELIGENRLLDDVADDLRVAQEAAVGAGGDIAERV